MRLAVLLLLLAFGLWAQTLIVSPAEITGDSTAHAVSTAGVARWIQFVAPSTNSFAVRVGDSNTGSARGIPIAAGGGYMMPYLQSAPGYDLTKIYYYASTGDKVNVSWAK